jgi:phosphatidate cytidylyltransferase
MLKRTITAIVAVAILIPVIYFSDTVIFPLFAFLCTLIAVAEMLKCCTLLHKLALSVPMMMLSVAPMACWLWRDQSEMLISASLVALLVIALYLFALVVFSHGKIQLENVCVAFLTTFYIVAAFTCIVYLRYLDIAGKYIYLICFIGAWMTDIFAYFAGRLFGKHKLIPDVSPKKTVEGSIGGIVFCIGAMLLFGYVINRIAGDILRANYLVLAISGLLISVVSQIGDLTMSAVKRHYGIKDFGKIFPGHGGMLDRFDSVMAVAVVLTAITSVTDLFTIL